MKRFSFAHAFIVVLGAGCGNQESLVLHRPGVDAAAPVDSAGETPDVAPPLPVELVQQILATSIPCDDFPTINEFERNFIVPSCTNGNSACHKVGTLFFPILTPPAALESSIFERLLDKRHLTTQGKPVSQLCPTDKWIDSVNPSRSLMLVKVASDEPRCSDGTLAGARQPHNEDPLTAEQIRCMESYVTTVSTLSRR